MPTLSSFYGIVIQMFWLALALVLEWATEHHSELLEDWELCRNMQTPKKIRPLA